MSKFTAGHYDAVASVLAHEYQTALSGEHNAVEMMERVIEDLGRLFEQDNPKFLRARWYLRTMGRTTRVRPVVVSNHLDPFTPPGRVS